MTPAPEVAVPPAGPDLSFFGSIANAGLAEQLVMLLLVIFSVVSWAIIAYKYADRLRAYRESEEFLDTFWKSKRLDAVYQKSQTLAGSPISQVFMAGYVELTQIKEEEEHEAADTQMGAIESVQRSMERARQQANSRSLNLLCPFLVQRVPPRPLSGFWEQLLGSCQHSRRLGWIVARGWRQLLQGLEVRWSRLHSDSLQRFPP